MFYTANNCSFEKKMFDPSISIYTAMVISKLTMGINDLAYRCGPLYITVDSNETILMNWDFKDCDVRSHPDKITLYFLDQKGKIIKESIETNGIERSYHETNQKFPAPMDNFPNGWNLHDQNPIRKTHCLPYIIESSIKGVLVDRRCLRIYPSWMQNFGELRIGEMLIPGTHNSGAWTTEMLVLSNYILNQDRNIYEQLVFGQRYFDIRLGITDENDIFMVHGLIFVARFEDELDSIVRFLEKSPKEVIILDIHKFCRPTEWTEEEHRLVLDLLKKKIGKFMMPRKFAEQDLHGPKLKTFWMTGNSIVVAYAEPKEVERNTFLWPAIKRDWGDKIIQKELLMYIVRVCRSKRQGYPMSVLMAELTPNAGYIAMKPLGGLGMLADEVNRNLTQWIKDYGLVSKLNLVATDYFLGNRLVEYSVGVNSMKEFKRREKVNRRTLVVY